METKKKQRKVHIPDELIFNILVRLPTKSLMRFKCVCKLWLSFISQLKWDDYKLVLSSCFSFQSVEIEASPIKASQLDFPLTSPNARKLIGSCNGLLCIAIESEGFVLWNPLTGTYKSVPELSSRLEDSCVGIGLGFGYDHSTDDYKIVKFVKHLSLGFLVDIFSLKNDSWAKQISQRFSVSSFLELNAVGTFVDGALYWTVTYFRDLAIGPLNAILHFDLVHNKMSVVRPPKEIGEKPEFDIGVFGGRFCMFHHHDVGHTDLWAREYVEVKQKWIKWMSIPHSEELPSDMFYEYHLVPVCFIKNQVLMNVRKMFRGSKKSTREKQFLLYDFEENAFRKFEIQDIQRFYQVTTYTPSLASPFRIGG